MEPEVAFLLGSEMLTTAAKLAAPILLSALVVGLIVSILQVTTQIQEMTLTFVPKIIVAVAVVMILGGWMLTVLTEYARNMFMFVINQ